MRDDVRLYSFLTHMILTLVLSKGVALVERTSSQVVRPASVEVAVLLEEEGNSQEARPALEEGELITYVLNRHLKKFLQ